jgi:ornithine cyclodeaminase/alanine dehydrogenase-like protein (mu-crystallin family)
MEHPHSLNVYGLVATDDVIAWSGRLAPMPLDEILWINQDEVERLLDADALLDALADGFRSMSAGEVLLGWRPGREAEGEITVYKAMGHAIEDLVAAELVYRAAQDDGTLTRLHP